MPDRGVTTTSRRTPRELDTEEDDESDLPTQLRLDLKLQHAAGSTSKLAIGREERATEKEMEDGSHDRAHHFASEGGWPHLAN